MNHLFIQNPIEAAKQAIISLFQMALSLITWYKLIVAIKLDLFQIDIKQLNNVGLNCESLCEQQQIK